MQGPHGGHEEGGPVQAAGRAHHQPQAIRVRLLSERQGQRARSPQQRGGRLATLTRRNGSPAAAVTAATLKSLCVAWRHHRHWRHRSGGPTFFCPGLLVLLLCFASLCGQIDAYVDFPVEGLDLSPFMVNSSLNTPANTVYDLYAVSNHYGGLFQHTHTHLRTHPPARLPL